MIRLPPKPDLSLTGEGLLSLILRSLGDAITHKCCVWTIRILRGYTPPGHRPNPMSLGVEIRSGSGDTIYVPASRGDSNWTLHGAADAADIFHVVAEVVRQCHKDPELRSMLRDIAQRDVGKTGPLRGSDAE